MSSTRPKERKVTNIDERQDLSNSSSDWSIPGQSISSRTGTVCNRQLYSDVTFVVGAEYSKENVIRVPAHKLILALASQVFHSMFYGQSKCKGVIDLPDVEPSAFVTLLKYIYADVIDINPENVLGTLYASKKYNLPHLTEACVKFLLSKLTPKNACTCYLTVRKFDEEELESQCFAIIGVHGDSALTSFHFTSLDHEIVKYILGHDSLICSEFTAFSALEKWAIAQCIRNGLKEDSITADDKRRVMGEALYLIRFPIMTLEDFTNGPAQSNVLTESEKLNLFAQYSAKNKPPIPFSSKERLSNNLCSRYYARNIQSTHGEVNSITFIVNRQIAISGFGLYASEHGNLKYTVSIQLKEVREDSEKILGLQKVFVNEKELKHLQIFKAFFNETIQIYPGSKYIASVKYKGAFRTYYGIGGQRNVTVCVNGESVKFRFFPTKGFTSVGQGHIPQILFHFLVPPPPKLAIGKQKEKSKEKVRKKENDWRILKRSVCERTIVLFNSQMYSDVKFIVGAEFSKGKPLVVHAHKLILALASEVFQSMFYGELKEQEIIHVPDVEPDAFLTLLKYIYTDVIDINPGNVLATLYASEKYITPHLTEACVKFLSSNIKAENVCAILAIAQRFNEKELASLCLEVIDAQGEAVLETSYFTSLDHETVTCILARDTLNCRELVAFNALDRWAKVQCLQSGLDESSMTGEDKRRAMGEALYLIRFPTMTLEEFTNGPAQSDVLTESDKLDLFVQYSAKNKPSIAFLSRPRLAFIKRNI